MNWFNQLFRPDTQSKTPRVEDLHRAAAALLLEVARTDGTVDEQESAHLLAVVQQRWQLDPGEMEDIVAEIHAHVDQATDLFEFTLPLRENWDAEQRVELIEEMWTMAAADGHADVYEEQLIRRVSELLYVSHGDYIRAKLKATDG